jgi:myo-inositol 2-dehydrogenase/D-chiro-inositol 1-dehydrogenase
MVPDRPVGVGLIGCGTIGQVHAACLGQLVEDGVVRAVAAADLSEPARAAADRNAGGFARLHADPQAVIHDDEVEAVLIASPTATHRELVLATVAAGKPLLCEKPLATTFPVVREMHDVVAASGLTAQVGFHSRFHYLFDAMKDLVVRGELGAPMGYVLREDQFWPTGEIVPGHSSWRSDRAQAGGGALLEHTIHGADVVSWLFGPATRVYARTRSLFGYDVEDVAAVTVEHQSGVIGTVLTVFNGVRGREERRLEVFFEQAAVEMTADFMVGAPEDGLMIQRPGSEAERPDLEALRAEHWRKLGVTRADVWFYLYLGAREWARAVREGRAASPGFADALVAHALVDAAYRSATTDAPVTLDGDLAVGKSKRREPGIPASRKRGPSGTAARERRR